MICLRGTYEHPNLFPHGRLHGGRSHFYSSNITLLHSIMCIFNLLQSTVLCILHVHTKKSLSRWQNLRRRSYNLRRMGMENCNDCKHDSTRGHIGIRGDIHVDKVLNNGRCGCQNLHNLQQSKRMLTMSYTMSVKIIATFSAVMPTYKLLWTACFA